MHAVVNGKHYIQVEVQLQPHNCDKRGATLSCLNTILCGVQFVNVNVFFRERERERESSRWSTIMGLVIVKQPLQIVRLRHTRGLEDLSPVSSASASSQFSFRKGNEVLGWRDREIFWKEKKLVLEKGGRYSGGKELKESNCYLKRQGVPSIVFLLSALFISQFSYYSR